MQIFLGYLYGLFFSGLILIIWILYKATKEGILCAFGWHRPLQKHSHNFIDKVSNKTVYNAKCPCGKKFMVDSPFGYFGSKVER